MIWVLLVVVGIAVERTTEILAESHFFKPVRDFIRGLAYREGELPTIWVLVKRWAADLVNCGYCISVWVSIFYSPTLTVPICEFSFYNWLVTVMLLHGISNLYHILFELIKTGRIRTYDIGLTITEKQEEHNGSS